MAKKTISTKAKGPSSQIPRVEFGNKKSDPIPTPDFLQTAVSPILLAQAVHTLQKRMRVRRAHTKERAEVRGGGRKPWAQKGTGRSRHASIRSPIWVGGGTTFGPRTRKERILPMPITMRRKALAGALTTHVKDNTLQIVAFTKELPTKTADFIKQAGVTQNLLIILAPQNAGVHRVARNIARMRTINVDRVTTTDIVRAHHVWIDEAGLAALEARCRINTAQPTTK